MSSFWTNFHTHCDLCDGRAPMEKFVENAISMKLRAYGISSHSPLPFVTRWNMLECNIPTYIDQFTLLKKKYGHLIDLFLGMEIDYIKGIMNVQAPWIQNTPLDYRIGSVHYMGQLNNGNFWTVDGVWDEFSRGIQEQFQGNYKKGVLYFFKQTKEMIELGGIDIIGHFDKITVQNQSQQCFSEQEHWYQNEIDEVLHLCKEKDIIIEINTKSIDRKGIFFPASKCWKTMLLNKNKIMINADSHQPDLITLGFSRTYNEIYEIGFREVAVLTHSGWQMMQIDNKGITEN